MSLIYIKNTIEILNNILESDTFPLMSGYYTVIKKHDLRSVISLLSDLQTENEKLQKMYQEEKVICHETQLELERMKKIMRKNGIMIISSKYPGSTENGIFRSHAIRRRNCKMNKCSLFDMTFSEIIEDIFGVSFDRLWELALADRERRCVVMPCQPGYKISYKSSTGFWCNAVIKDYTPENIFITAETEIPNAEPLSHTFSILEIESAPRREKE